MHFKDQAHCTLCSKQQQQIDEHRPTKMVHFALQAATMHQKEYNLKKLLKLFTKLGKNISKGKKSSRGYELQASVNKPNLCNLFRDVADSQFQKLISLAHVCMATYIEFYKNDPSLEMKTWEICGQDFVVDMCGCVEVFVPLITFLVQLQGLSMNYV